MRRAGAGLTPATERSHTSQRLSPARTAPYRRHAEPLWKHNGTQHEKRPHTQPGPNSLPLFSRPLSLSLAHSRFCSRYLFLSPPPGYALTLALSHSLPLSPSLDHALSLSPPMCPLNLALSCPRSRSPSLFPPLLVALSQSFTFIAIFFSLSVYIYSVPG